MDFFSILERYCMKKWAVIVAVLIGLLGAGLAEASPAGEKYWLSFGPYLSAGAMFQDDGDESAEAALDAPFGGGLGIAHIGTFSWQALFEGDFLPMSPGGAWRAEGTLGFLYLTLGGGIAQFFGSGVLTTLGPAAALHLPLTWGPNEREGRVDVLSLFYRLDFPVAGPRPAEDYDLKHHVGLRYQFDFPGLLRLFKTPGQGWWGAMPANR
jgi:hypothetical protein